MTDQWTDRLSEYIDGELDDRDRAALEAHLPGCAACRRTLDELRTVVAYAARLQPTAPETDLWTGILTRIRGDTARVIPIGLEHRSASAEAPRDVHTLDRDRAVDTARSSADAPARRASRRFTLSLPQLAAAAAIVAFLSGGGVWIALTTSGGADPAFITDAPPAITAAADPDVEFTGAGGYGPAIRQLEQELELIRERLDPETIQVIERNLQVIDAAIDEAREALASDPANPFLHRHLDATMTKKIEMLRRVTTLGRGNA